MKITSFFQVGHDAEPGLHRLGPDLESLIEIGRQRLSSWSRPEPVRTGSRAPARKPKAVLRPGGPYGHPARTIQTAAGASTPAGVS